MAKKGGNKLVAYIFCLFVMHTKPTKTRSGGEIEMEGASVGVVSLSVSQCHVAFF